MNTEFPVDYRWARGNGLEKMIPWHFIEYSEGEFANRVYEKEKKEDLPVATFARRQDCDDFAGFEVLDGKITNTVVYFHPSFQSKGNDYLVNARYEDFWKFMTEVVIPDTKDWADEINFEHLDD